MLKKIFLSALLTLLVLAVFAILFYDHAFKKNAANFSVGPAVSTTAWYKKMKQRSEAIKNFAVKNNYDTQIVFLVDMSLPSGMDRFFVVDLSKDSLLMKGLVAHGCCNKTWLSGRQYGNTVGCGCTSLGKYKIGNSYMGQFGLAYKLHGLDTSNSNAFKRFVVLHSHECVPGSEVDPAPICQSNGCPTVSPYFLQKLKAILDKSRKPVLLYVYE